MESQDSATPLLKEQPHSNCPHSVQWRRTKVTGEAPRYLHPMKMVIRIINLQLIVGETLNRRTEFRIFYVCSR